MTQSFFVYGFMLIVMMFLGYVSSVNDVINGKPKSSFWGFSIIFSLILFAVISGLRYDVGVDYLGYLQLYQNISIVHLTDFDSIEVGFRWILEQLASINAHFAWTFGIFAFIQIFFIYYAFKSEKYLYLFISFVLITSGTYFTMMNEIRQSIVWSIFIFSIRFANKKHIIQYLLFVFIGSLFHKSAFLLVPILLFIYPSKDYFKSVWIQLIILLAVIFISEISIWDNFIKQISSGSRLLYNSDKYIDIDSRLSFWEHNYNKGFRFYGNAFIYIATIFYSKKIKSYFKSEIILKYYNLYFIGALLYFLTYSNTLMQRPARYFTCMQIVISSYLFLYLWKKRKTGLLNLLLFTALILVHFLIFVAFVRSNHHTYYYFFWD